MLYVKDLEGHLTRECLQEMHQNSGFRFAPESFPEHKVSVGIPGVPLIDRYEIEENKGVSVERPRRRPAWTATPGLPPKKALVKIKSSRLMPKRFGNPRRAARQIEADEKRKRETIARQFLSWVRGVAVDGRPAHDCFFKNPFFVNELGFYGGRQYIIMKDGRKMIVDGSGVDYVIV
jgi:hypothetical protein